MNLHQVEEKLSIQVANIEEEETRLREWLHCLRRLGAIAKEWEVPLAEINLLSAAEREPFAPVDPFKASMETPVEETQPQAQVQSAFLNRDRFEMNLQQLRRSGEQQKEDQRLQEREFEQLREQLCASRPKSSNGGRMGSLMSFLMKV